MNYLFIVVAIILLGGGAFYFSTNSKNNVVEEPKTDVEKTPSTEVYSDAAADVSDDTVTETTITAEGDVSVVSDEIDVTKTFDVKGTNFAYDVKEIRVKEGDTVTINFESADGFHDWVVDAFEASTQKVKPGTPTSVTFVADKAGTYEYYCSVGSHRAQGMVGTLIVE